jgi:hypothetical protein
VKEASVEAYLCRRVKEMKGRALKLQRLRGWPDRLILVKGQTWYVECKRPHGGRFEPLQRRVGQWLLARGYNYIVLNTREGVDTWVSGL